MAAISRVVSVDYMQKRSLILIRDETFGELATKVSGDPNAKFAIECSENGKDWTEIDTEVVGLPSIGVLDCFNYKFVRMNKQEPPTDTNVPSPLLTTPSANAFDVLMSVRKKRRLPDMKTNRCAELTSLRVTMWSKFSI